MSRQVGHHKVVESVWCKHYNFCLGSSREVRTSCREERPIILALLCNCFKDCDPQAKMTGRNYWCRHLIYHLHNGLQDQPKKPSASYDGMTLVSPWWGGSRHLSCVIMYSSLTSNVIKPYKPPNTQTTTYFQENAKNWNFWFYVFSQCETVILVAVHVDTITTTSYANVFPENQVSTKRHHHDQTVSLLYKWKWALCFVI